MVVITSQNFDGEWIARILHRFGFGTARGSTSRGGRARARAAAARLAAGRPAAFTVDGPRGPARIVQAGRRLARWRPPVTRSFRITSRRIATGRVELGPHADPKPFSTVAILIGEPLYLKDTSDPAIEAGRLELEQALGVCEERALAALRD